MLLCARYVLPVSSEPIEGGAVLVRDGLIADIGKAEELKARYPEEELRDWGVASLMPGFVNTHTHLEYAAMRGLVNDLPYTDWKLEVAETSSIFTPQDWEDSALLGCLEAIASGITTVADASRSGAALHAVDRLGLRGIIYRKAGSLNRKHVDAAVDKAIADIEEWKALVEDKGLIRIGISPRPCHSCNPRVYSRICDYVGDSDMPVAMSIAASREEYNFIKFGASPLSSFDSEQGAGFGIDMPPFLPTGESPVRYLDNWGIFDLKNFVAVHCVHVDERDIEVLADRGVRVAHCARVDAKLSAGIAPLGSFIRAGIPVGLGSDSPAASDGMDMFDEMRIALLIQRAASTVHGFLSTQQMIYMATLGAAEVLGMADRIGSLEVGKEADIIAVDLHNSHQRPLHDPNMAIVHSSNQDNVRMTMVHGKMLYDDKDGIGQGHCAGVDPNEVRARAENLRLKNRVLQ